MPNWCDNEVSIKASRNDCYMTPRWLAQQLAEEYGITIDACANEKSAVVPRFWGPKEDGLLKSWKDEKPYVNPPFDDCAAWVRKAYNEMKLHGVTSVMLVPMRRDQYWFKFALEHAQVRLLQAGLLFFPGFGEQKGLVAKIDPVIFIFGPQHPGHTTGPLILPPFKSDTAKLKVPGIRMYTAPINKPAGALNVRQYAELVPYLDAFAEGYINFLVILGWPGLAKSTLFRSRLPQSACWIRGNGSPFLAYINAYKSVNDPIVMDDVEGLLRKPGGIELLRQLCESEGVKTITWESDAALLKKENIPTEFATTSKVCFIANDWARLNARLMALEDRAIVVSFEPNALEVHEQIGREGWFTDEEIYNFIGQHLHLVMRPSMRFYVRAKEIKEARNKLRSPALQWSSWLFRQWLADESLFRVAMLLADDHFPSNRARADEFVKQSWGARSTFYQRAKELRPNGVVRDSDGFGTVSGGEVLAVPAIPAKGEC